MPRALLFVEAADPAAAPIIRAIAAQNAMGPVHETQREPKRFGIVFFDPESKKVADSL